MGSRANRTKIEIISSFRPNNFPKTKIKLGKIKHFATELVIKSYLVDVISSKSKAQPIDKSPKGSAALLKI